MWKWLMKRGGNESGQAMAEYHVLIPGSILMVLAAYVLLGGSLHDKYCSIVGMFRPSVCAVEAAQASGDSTPEPEITPEPTEDACVVLQGSEGCSQCDQSADCTCLPGVNSGSYSPSRPIESLVIKAGREYHVYYTGDTDDHCYHVIIEGSYASWTRIGSGSTCKDISHLESWYQKICQ
jgi:hypothetical protein